MVQCETQATCPCLAVFDQRVPCDPTRLLTQALLWAVIFLLSREPLCGYTPLMEAAASGHEIIVQYLLNHVSAFSDNPRHCVKRPGPPCAHNISYCTF